MVSAPQRAWPRGRLTLLVLVVAALSLAAAAGPATARTTDGSAARTLAHGALYAPGIPAVQQSQLGTLLHQAGAAGLPLRVAILSAGGGGARASAQAAARQLSVQLAPGYRGAVLVVSPRRLALTWPGHATAAEAPLLRGVRTGASPGALVSATEAAVGSLAAAAGARIGSTPATGAAATATAVATATSSIPTVPTDTVGAAGASAASSGHGTDTMAAAVVGGLVVVALIAYGTRYLLRRRRRQGEPADPEPRSAARSALLPGVAVLCGVAILVPAVLLAHSGGSSTAGSEHTAALSTNPVLDPGTPLDRTAPNFTLRNQFGQPVSLSSFRGKVVLLAFNDSECTTVCPLTTTAMVDAKEMLGPAASQIKLLGVNANPTATAIKNVAAYSAAHGMMRSWDFLTGQLHQLKHVWHEYSVESEIVGGQIDHIPALFVIGPDGREAKVYMTQMSYAAVGQLGQLVAQEAASLLPGHPKVHARLSYRRVPPIKATANVRLPAAGGGTLGLGPGRPHVYLFFATWTRAVTDLAAHLRALNAYTATAAASGLPPLSAVDEGSVEPSARALPAFLRTLGRPLSYPVAIDTSGRVGDGYEALDEPWLVVTSATGHILWYHDVSTAGWPSVSRLVRDVRAALSRAPAAPATAAGAAQALAGSPSPLAALHRQAAQVLGGEPALAARIRALRGYPIVLNAWATWCAPCQEEFGLFRTAAVLYGKRVAFLGANTNDPGDSQGFLDQHPVSYPSYRTSSADLSWLANVGYLPTTVFISAAGKIVHVNTGQYTSQGALDGDISSYVLGGG